MKTSSGSQVETGYKRSKIKIYKNIRRLLSLMRLVTELYHRQEAPFREVSIYFPALNDISDGKNLGDLQFFDFGH